LTNNFSAGTSDLYIDGISVSGPRLNPSTNTITAGTFAGALSGNATTATTLQTARNINGVSFNGSADITVADSTKLPLAGGTMTGAITFAAGQTWPTFNQDTTGTAGGVAWTNVSGRPTALSSFTNDTGFITSDSTKLPLAGGTLTGGLQGTSATFTGNITVSSGNSTGGGIILADDGDIVDLNDSFCSMRFSGGVRIFSANRGGSAVITLSNGGSITASGDITAFSDERVKENINTIENALDKVKALRGVTYNRTDKSDKSEKIGVIAQEIQEVLPQVVHEQEDGMLGVSYGNIVALLIEAIKEQQKQIDELKNR
jgi:hypothetical protein